MTPRLLARVAPLLVAACVFAGLQASCARSVTSDFSSDPQLIAPGEHDAAAFNLCVATECPPPWATCPGQPGLCTTDTSRDVRYCGSCTTPCPEYPPHASSLCSNGKCAIACDELYADCNHDAADGCETATESDPKNCGFCGNACADGVLCWRGACGCPNGLTQCGDDCKKLDSDVDNCSACGKLCRRPADTDPAWTCGAAVTPPHTGWTCATSACMLLCSPGFGDCNDAFCADGCETDLRTDAANCGACGHACDEGQSCVDGTCICPSGTTRCDDTCIDLTVDPKNCGACGYRCPGPPSSGPFGKPGTGSPGCVASQCTYVCFPGFADCDKSISNGCEVNLGTDPEHCGTCAGKCNVGPGQPCVEGKCLTRECDAGVVL